MKRKYLSIITLLLFVIQISAEDGSRLWLRNDTSNHANITCNNASQTAEIAVDELQKAWKGAPITLTIREDCSVGEQGFNISSKDGGITLSAKSPIRLLYGTPSPSSGGAYAAPGGNPATESGPSDSSPAWGRSQPSGRPSHKRPA